MAFVHGKGSVTSLGGSDLSVYSNSVAWNRMADSHDVTTFGKNSHVKQGGLFDGSATVSGIYDNTASVSPRAVIMPKVGTVVAMVWRPEGTAAGRPQDTVNVLVGKYSESSPVADMIAWTLDVEMSDDIATVTQ